MNFIPIHSLKIYHAFKGLNAKHRKIQFILDTLRLWRRRMKGEKKKLHVNVTPFRQNLKLYFSRLMNNRD